MTKFTTIQSWLEAKPEQEEILKVLSLINKGETHKIRKELYEAENYLRKLYRSRTYCERAGFSLPKQALQFIDETKKKIEDLKKLVPAPKLKPKKFIGDDVTETTPASNSNSQEVKES